MVFTVYASKLRHSTCIMCIATNFEYLTVGDSDTVFLKAADALGTYQPSLRVMFSNGKHGRSKMTQLCVGLSQR